MYADEWAVPLLLPIKLWLREKPLLLSGGHILPKSQWLIFPLLLRQQKYSRFSKHFPPGGKSLNLRVSIKWSKCHVYFAYFQWIWSSFDDIIDLWCALKIAPTHRPYCNRPLLVFLVLWRTLTAPPPLFIMLSENWKMLRSRHIFPFLPDKSKTLFDIFDVI